MDSAGKSKYQDDKDFIQSFTLSNQKCDGSRGESTENDTNITKDKGEVVGFDKTIKATEYQMLSILSDADAQWDKNQVKELKFEEVKFTDTQQMRTYLKYYGEAITHQVAVNNRQTKQKEMDNKIVHKKKLEANIFRAKMELEAYVDDWKKRLNGDQSITVAVTKARLAWALGPAPAAALGSKHALERTNSVLMAGEAKELARILVDFFVEKVGVTEANLDESVEKFWMIFDGEEDGTTLSLAQFTHMSAAITAAGQPLTRSEMKHIFERIDTDNSDSLEKTEFVKEITAIFHETHGQQSKKQNTAATPRSAAAAAFFGGST